VNLDFWGILEIGKLENSRVIELRILGSVESGGFWILGVCGFGNYGIYEFRIS